MKISLDSIISGFKSVTTLVSNFGKIQTNLNDKVLYRDNPEGEPNQMENLLDMNGYAIINQSNPVTVDGFNWEGDYSGATAYSVGDAVQYNGTAYIAIAESTGQTPPNATYWQIVVTANLPTQTGNQDKPLTTNGSVSSWGSIHADYVDFTNSGTGGTERTLQAKLEDTVSVKDFGAVGDGVTDDTAAIQAALDTGSKVSFPDGTYNISSSLILKTDGQTLEGQSKLNTVIEATNSAFDMIIVGDSSVDVTGAATRTTIRNLYIKGQPSTTCGVKYLTTPTDNATWNDASKGCMMENVRITGVGAGEGLSVGSWSNNFYSVEIWDCLEGARFGFSANNIGSYGFYISGCTNAGLIVDATGSGVSSNLNFYNSVVQLCGESELGKGSVQVKKGFGVNFNGLYMERNNLTGGGNKPSVTVANTSQNVHIANATYITEGSVADQTVIETQGKHVNIEGVSVFGTVDQVVLAPVGVGLITYQTVKGLFMSSGTATNGVFVDNSDRKYSHYNNGSVNSTFGHVANNTTSAMALAVKNVDSDAITAFFNGDGTLYFGSTTSSPNLDPVGTTLEVKDGASVGNIRFGVALIGSGSVRLKSGSGSPEGLHSGDVGSIYLRTDGGAGSTMYVKETGAGTTGWVAK
jgi:hypothetical protein